MGYRLAEQNGESVAVPRLVFAHLARADGDTIRAALYLLGPHHGAGSWHAQH